MMSQFQSKPIRTILWCNVVALVVLVLLQLFKNQLKAIDQPANASSKYAYLKIGRVEGSTPYLELHPQILKKMFAHGTAFDLGNFWLPSTRKVPNSFQVKRIDNIFYLVGAHFDAPQGIFFTTALTLRNAGGNLLMQKNVLAQVKPAFTQRKLLKASYK
ncbi:MAG: hypothetical protein ACFB0B_06650 [Thermonemataceae bacterium]|mgnify:CR=1 FL=1